jgi:hypothetical protein
VDTPVQQQQQHWQRVEKQADINPSILESRMIDVNLLLTRLDESFEWKESKKATDWEPGLGQGPKTRRLRAVTFLE